MESIFFNNNIEFREWLKRNYKTEKEVSVGFYKVHTKKPSMTWSQSVDEALCFGWIDGIRNSIDSDSYCIRFTPRNPKSNWSRVNIDKVNNLIAQGLMQPAGLELFNNRKIDNSEVYSYENKPEKLDENLDKIFSANHAAYNYFKSQSQSYKKTIFHWIMSAKQTKTQLDRLNKLIAASEQKKKIF